MIISRSQSCREWSRCFFLLLFLFLSNGSVRKVFLPWCDRKTNFRHDLGFIASAGNTENGIRRALLAAGWDGLRVSLWLHS